MQFWGDAGMKNNGWTSYESKTVTADELLTLDEAATLLKVPKSWIYERTRKGAIPHLKLGKYLRFPRAALLQWVSTQGRAGDPK